MLSNSAVTPSLKLEELLEFSHQLLRLPCVIDQAELVQVYAIFFYRYTCQGQLWRKVEKWSLE